MQKRVDQEVCRPAPQPEEELARVCIQQALGVPVCWHDDGSSTQEGVGMYDLAINYPTRPAVPVAVTTHVDSDAIETRNTLSKKLTKGIWPAQKLTQAWGLHTNSNPPLKRLHTIAEDCLAVLENAGITSFDLSTYQSSQMTRQVKADVDASSALDAEGALLGVGVHRASSFQPGPAGPMIYLYLDRGEWTWDGSSDPIVAWIDELVADPDRVDNLRQLRVAARAPAFLRNVRFIRG